MRLPEPSLDRAAARARIARRRQRRIALALSAELRAAARADLLLRDLLNAIADEMDMYDVPGMGEPTGTDEDPPTWRAALVVARTINAQEQVGH